MLAALLLAANQAWAFTAQGFSNPYGVAVDERTNFIFVSNVAGSLDAKDDNGFISRLRGDGSIDNLKFIDGAARSIDLNAPKGMAVVGTTLYVCDIDKLRAYDTTYGNHLFDVNFGNLPVQHLYDVKQGPGGVIYVADGPGNRIYKVDIPRQHEVTTLTMGDSLGQPHGLVWFPPKQVFAVAGWSSGQVTAYNRSGKMRPLPAVFLRTLEGMDADNKGNIYVSSTGLGGIYMIDKDFALHSFNTGIDSPSGIAFHKAGEQIITASFNGNTVESMPIGPQAATPSMEVTHTQARPAPESTEVFAPSEDEKKTKEGEGAKPEEKSEPAEKPKAKPEATKKETEKKPEKEEKAETQGG